MSEACAVRLPQSPDKPLQFPKPRQKDWLRPKTELSYCCDHDFVRHTILSRSRLLAWVISPRSAKASTVLRFADAANASCESSRFLSVCRVTVCG